MHSLFVRALGGRMGLASNSFVFLGAIFLALAISLYVSSFGRGPWTWRETVGIVAFVAGLLAAGVWSMLAWMVDGLTSIALSEASRKEPGDPAEESRQLQRIVDSSFRRLMLMLTCGLFLSIASFGLVPLALG